MPTPILPRPDAPLWHRSAMPTQAWYDFFRNLMERINDDADLSREIEAIQEQLEKQGNASIVGSTGVVKVFGSLKDGQVTISLDETLNALAAANWAANAFPIGTGPDTVAQVSFAPNTFPARDSASDLEPKAITDYALSLLDDADAAAARTTLGLGAGTYIPTITNGANVVASTALFCQFFRVGEAVTVSGVVIVDTAAAGGTATTFGLSLPVPSNFSALSQCGGSGTGASTTYEATAIYGDPVNDRAAFNFQSQSVGSRAVTFSLTYLVV